MNIARHLTRLSWANDVLNDFRSSPTAAKRPFALMYFAAYLVSWFEAFEDLGAVRLTALAHIEAEDGGATVAFRHHFKLVAETASGNLPRNFPEGHDAVIHFALEALPYTGMGSGTVEIRRENPLLQSALWIPEEDALKTRAALFALADEIDGAFTYPEVRHDMGLRTVYE